MKQILTKKRIGILSVVLIIGILSLSAYFYLPTKIAFVNFQDSQMASILKANQNSFIQTDKFDLKEDNLSSIIDYKVIYLFHVRGLSDEQKMNLEKARDNGAKIYFHASTSGGKDNNTIEGEDLEYVSACFKNGGLKNYEKLLNYSRVQFDGKSLFSDDITEPIEYPSDVFYRIGTDKYFTEIGEYWKYYEENGFHKEGQQKIVIVNAGASFQTEYRSYQDKIITTLESKNYNVVCVGGWEKRFENLKSIEPDLVIYFPHGRLVPRKGDEIVDWLKQRNIPILTPQLVHQTYEDWMADQQGMSGGLMGQNIVVPELDGAIFPYVVAAKYKNDKGLFTYKEIPGRVERFCENVDRWLNLKTTANSEKKLCIYYYKGVGKNAIVAEGLEIGTSLLSLLDHLRDSGYNTGMRHPKTAEELLEIIQKEGPLLGAYAQGTFDKYIKEGKPALISASEYEQWCKEELDPESYREVVARYGEAPGSYLTTTINDTAYLAIPRVLFGNIALLPVLPAAMDENEFKFIHGVKKAPPHAYIASYLWARKGFNTDVVSHFGTHGSVEFTPWKQVTLSLKDWPEALLAPTPHLYVYSINNIGEAMMAKRRTYATMITHVTPPYTESGLYDELEDLEKALHHYSDVDDARLKERYKSTIQGFIDSLNLENDLGLDSISVVELDEQTVSTIDNYVHHLNNEKITTGLHTFGKSFTEDEIKETVRMMSIDPLTSTLVQLAIINGNEDESILEQEHELTEKYRSKADQIIREILYEDADPMSFIDENDLKGASDLISDIETENHHDHSHGHNHNSEEEHLSDKALNEKELLGLLEQYKEVLVTIPVYLEQLSMSPKLELEAFINGMNGGYIEPSSGGDPAFNPNSIPTGKNLYSINAENTPTKEAWEVGKQLGDMVLQQHIAKHGEYPKKIAYSLWGSEFIRNEGMNIAQIFYLLGVEPIRNTRGRVHDIKLIPIEKLGRPRIDVVVQTSGQFRDIAASRISLINKAIKMAANANDDGKYTNYVKEGTLLAEQNMKENGLSPADARKFSTIRVFGGVNGSYGTGIMGLVEKGDRWETDKDIADQYLKNMGSVYSDDDWCQYQEGIFKAMLQNTEIVMHPRSSNVTGPISLDHVYEFMGGLTASVRNETGKDPDGYFNDYRNKYNPTVQGLKEAIWSETRTHLFNPKFIEAQLKEGASAAEGFAENFRDTYGWNVMKPNAIDEELWDGYYEIYVQDKYNLEVQKFFKEKNPYALQEMTAVMLETIRKGYWNPDESVVKDIANLHADLIKNYEAGCSGFVCDNAKLKEMIEQTIGEDLKETYNQEIDKVRTGGKERTQEGMVLKKEEITVDKVKEIIQDNMTALITLIIAILLFGGAVVFGIIKRRKAKK